MIRIFDLFFATLALLVFLPIIALCSILICSDGHNPIFSQSRVGRYGVPFTLYKLRTMRYGTNQVPTHLVNNSRITKIGFFLRRTKLDELPQLLNVIRGEMSIVGPRPCLLSQTELINRRKAFRIDLHRPGLTGLAQIRGVDMSTPRRLAYADFYMLKSLTLCSYFSYILRTIVK